MQVSFFFHQNNLERVKNPSRANIASIA